MKKPKMQLEISFDTWSDTITVCGIATPVSLFRMITAMSPGEVVEVKVLDDSSLGRFVTYAFQLPPPPPRGFWAWLTGTD